MGGGSVVLVVVAERMALGRVRRPDFYENLLGAHRRVVCVYVFVELGIGKAAARAAGYIRTR